MKVFIISHIADPDGITPVILSKLAFDQVDYLLLENGELEAEVIKLIESNALSDYDLVYITDLGSDEKIYKIIEEDTSLKSKIKLIDHHIGNMIANKYSFGQVIDINDNNIKESATSLFYNHLLDNYSNNILKQESVREFVDLVRLYDTWEWTKTNNMDAKRLSNLFDIYGKEYFLNHYLNFLKENETFLFDEKELYLLEIEEKRINNYIENKKQNIIPVSIDKYTAGLVFASQYRSETGNALAKHFIDVYDFIILISVERSVSYRGVKDIDLNEIAKTFNGKGHKLASGSPLPSNLHEEIIKVIFNEKVSIIYDK